MEALPGSVFHRPNVHPFTLAYSSWPLISDAMLPLAYLGLHPMTPRDVNPHILFSRRALLKSLSWAAPIVFRPSALIASALPTGPGSSLPFSDVRLTPHYPIESPLADILRRVTPGSDEYITEKYAIEIEAILRGWGRNLIASPQNLGSITESLSPALQA